MLYFGSGCLNDASDVFTENVRKSFPVVEDTILNFLVDWIDRYCLVLDDDFGGGCLGKGSDVHFERLR
jgi:hypothetical protein